MTLIPLIVIAVSMLYLRRIPVDSNKVAEHKLKQVKKAVDTSKAIIPDVIGRAFPNRHNTSVHNAQPGDITLLPSVRSRHAELIHLANSTAAEHPLFDPRNYAGHVSVFGQRAGDDQIF